MNSDKNVGKCPCGSGWDWSNTPVVLSVPQDLPYSSVVSNSSNAIDLLSYALVGGLALDQFNGMGHPIYFGTYPRLLGK